MNVLTFMPGVHLRKDDCCNVFKKGNLKKGNVLFTNKGTMANTILRCQLREHSNCPCKAELIKPASSLQGEFFISRILKLPKTTKAKHKSTYLL